MPENGDLAILESVKSESLLTFSKFDPAPALVQKTLHTCQKLQSRCAFVRNHAGMEAAAADFARTRIFSGDQPVALIAVYVLNVQSVAMVNSHLQEEIGVHRPIDNGILCIVFGSDYIPDVGPV
uniref:Uncharacterized protein n=1 Tax=Romanomermis culicivorax TaxID=13658 RepID=A0A915II71_ROMCU